MILNIKRCMKNCYTMLFHWLSEPRCHHTKTTTWKECPSWNRNNDLYLKLSQWFIVAIRENLLVKDTSLSCLIGTFKTLFEKHSQNCPSFIALLSDGKIEWTVQSKQMKSPLLLFSCWFQLGYDWKDKTIYFSEDNVCLTVEKLIQYIFILLDTGRGNMSHLFSWGKVIR